MLRALIKGALSVGVAELDAEHDVFARLSGELTAAISERRMDRVAGMATRLVAHAFDHFSNEERTLVRIGYAAYDEEAFAAHVDEHNRIKPVLAALLRKGDFAVPDALAIQVLLADHLLVWDMKYKSYAEEAAARAAPVPCASPAPLDLSA